MQEKKFFRIQFVFEDHPYEYFNVEESRWLKILDLSREVSATMSWNDLKNQIYYAVVMGTAEFTTTA